MFPEVFQRVWMYCDVFGHSRMRSDTFGCKCVWMRLDEFGRILTPNTSVTFCLDFGGNVLGIEIFSGLLNSLPGFLTYFHVFVIMSLVELEVHGCVRKLLEMFQTNLYL